VNFPDFQLKRVSEEPVCIHLFRQYPVFTSLQLKSSFHVLPHQQAEARLTPDKLKITEAEFKKLKQAGPSGDQTLMVALRRLLPPQQHNNS